MTSMKRKLRKWLHTCTAFGSDVSAETALNASTKTVLSQSFIVPLEAPHVAGFEYMAFDGSRPIGPGSVFPYVEHHQFRAGTKRKATGILG